MKVQLDKITEKNVKAHDQPAKQAPQLTSLRCVAEELKAESVTIDLKEVLKEFVTRFQRRVDPKSKVPGGTQKPEAKHFFMGAPPITPTRTMTSSPGLGTRE